MQTFKKLTNMPLIPVLCDENKDHFLVEAAKIVQVKHHTKTFKLSTAPMLISAEPINLIDLSYDRELDNAGIILHDDFISNQPVITNIYTRVGSQYVRFPINAPLSVVGRRNKEDSDGETIYTRKEIATFKVDGDKTLDIFNKPLQVFEEFKFASLDISIYFHAWVDLIDNTIRTVVSSIEPIFINGVDDLSQENVQRLGNVVGRPEIIAYDIWAYRTNLFEDVQSV